MPWPAAAAISAFCFTLHHVIVLRRHHFAGLFPCRPASCIFIGHAAARGRGRLRRKDALEPVQPPAEARSDAWRVVLGRVLQLGEVELDHFGQESDDTVRRMDFEGLRERLGFEPSHISRGGVWLKSGADERLL